MREIIIKFKEWWNNLATREKRIVSIGVIVVSIFIVYAALWSPLSNHVNEMRNKINQSQTLLVWMKDVSAQIKKIERHSSTNTETSTPVVLLGQIQKEINTAGLNSSLKQLKQANNDAIEIHFEKVNFDKCMELLIHVCKKYNVVIEQLVVTSVGGEGVVNADVMLG